MATTRKGSFSDSRPALARLVRAFSFVFGAVLLGYMLYRFGSARVWLDLKSIGWRLLPIIALELMINGFNALGWWHTFPRQTRGGTLKEMFLVRLAGSALNQTLPAASLGGEPVRVLLLKHRFPMSVTAAAVLSTKAAESLARALFVVCGMFLASGLIRPGYLPMRSLVIGFILTALGVAAFMTVQLGGFSGSLTSLVARLRVLGRSGKRIELGLKLAGEHLRELYGSRPLDFAAAVALSLAGLCLGVIQVWLMMGWLGLRRDWLSSLAVEAFSVLVNFILFAVPGSLGVQEGGKLLIFAALGLPVSTGLSIGVAFRLNSLANVAAGLAALAWLRPHQASGADRATPSVCGSRARRQIVRAIDIFRASPLARR